MPVIRLLVTDLSIALVSYVWIHMGSDTTHSSQKTER